MPEGCLVIVSAEQTLQIKAALSEARVRQRVLAERWGITQGHLSKVITGKVPANPFLEGRLNDLLRGGVNRGKGIREVEEMAGRLASRSDLHAAKIMHILQAMEALIDQSADEVEE